VVQRELTGADLDRDVLLELVRADDPLGVLSIYVDAHDRRTAAIEVKNRLAELERRLADNGSAELADAVPRLIRRVTPVLQRLLGAGGAGRGRALFAPLEGSGVTTFSSQLRLPNRVVLDSSAFIHPLVELQERGRPAGVVLLWAHAAELLDWRLGEMRPVGRVTAEPATAAPRQRTGAVAASGPRGRQITPLRDQRQREERARLIVAVAEETDRLARERRWERILVSGSERLTAPLSAELPGCLRDVAIWDARQLDELDPASLAAVVGDRLGEEQDARALRLGRQVRDAALGAGRGALGLSEVVAALNEARVEHVVYDPRVRYTGALAADGSMFGWSEGAGVGVAGPRLTERIVERALDTGARLTPVEGAASEVLQDADGIAALLRW
jgi:Bacterial archaeo-eukaryotic release factor family 10